MIVCYQCLKAIESRGEEIVSIRHNDSENCTCDWCECEYDEPYELYEIEIE